MFGKGLKEHLTTVYSLVSAHGRLKFMGQNVGVGAYTENPFLWRTYTHMNHRTMNKLWGGHLHGHGHLLWRLRQSARLKYNSVESLITLSSTYHIRIDLSERDVSAIGLWKLVYGCDNFKLLCTDQNILALLNCKVKLARKFILSVFD